MDEEIAKGLIAELASVAKRCCTYIYWYHTADQELSPIDANGSACFLQIDDVVLGITAHHVIEGWERFRAAQPSAVFHLGDLEIEPLSRLKSRNPELDIATLIVSEDELEAIGSGVHMPESWPPPHLNEGDGILFGDFLAPIASSKETRLTLDSRTRLLGSIKSTIQGSHGTLSACDGSRVHTRRHPRATIGVELAAAPCFGSSKTLSSSGSLLGC